MKSLFTDSRMIICQCVPTLMPRMCVTTSVFGLSADLSSKYSMIASLLYSLEGEKLLALYINSIVTSRNIKSAY